jgi:hypothetical protein
MNEPERKAGFAKALDVDQHLVALDASEVAGKLLSPVELFGENDPGLVALPVVIILEASQRPVDAGELTSSR